MERYREKRREKLTVFVDLEKAYVGILREVMLDKKQVLCKYIEAIKI